MSLPQHILSVNPRTPKLLKQPTVLTRIRDNISIISSSPQQIQNSKICGFSRVLVLAAGMVNRCGHGQAGQPSADRYGHGDVVFLPGNHTADGSEIPNNHHLDV